MNRVRALVGFSHTVRSTQKISLYLHRFSKEESERPPTVECLSGLEDLFILPRCPRCLASFSWATDAATVPRAASVMIRRTMDSTHAPTMDVPTSVAAQNVQNAIARDEHPITLASMMTAPTGVTKRSVWSVTTRTIHRLHLLLLLELPQRRRGPVEDSIARTRPCFLFVLNARKSTTNTSFDALDVHFLKDGTP